VNPESHPHDLAAVTAAERAGDDVIGRLRAAGFTAFRVGGCVRDRLLGRSPGDVDVATDAVPAAVRGLFPHAFAVGESFGVIIVHAAEGTDIEVATFRAEAGYADGRHPDHVRFSTPDEDARRRDFTVNALFYDPCGRRILDFVGGLADLRRGVAASASDPAARFAEDHLRMLRAVRFAAATGFELDAATRAAVASLAPRLSTVSAERVYQELDRMLLGPDPAAAFTMLADLGLLAVWLPELAAMQGVPQPPQFHPEGDVWVHTMRMLSLLRFPDSALAWAVLLHDVGKPVTHEFADGRDRFPQHAEAGAGMAETLLRRLRASRRQIEAVTACVDNHMTFMAVPDMRPSTLRRLIARPFFPLELELHRLDCAGSHGRQDNYCLLLDRMAEIAAEPPVPPPLVTGHDVLALGIRPGPRVGVILRAVQDRQLNGDITTREEALAVLAQLATET